MAFAALIGLAWWWAAEPAGERSVVGDRFGERSAGSSKPQRSPQSTAPAGVPRAGVASGRSVDAASPQRSLGNPPIPVTPGFEALLSPGEPPPPGTPGALILEQHAKFSTESRDVAWTSRVDGVVREMVEGELLKGGLDPHRIDVSVIDCVDSLCELQATMPTEDSLKPYDFQFVVGRAIQGPLANEFDLRGMAIHRHDIPGGRTGYLVFLPRSKP